MKKLHEKSIVHRNIKAANVFFVKNRAKLGDFNISKVMEDSKLCTTLTGTPNYMSPEVWLG